MGVVREQAGRARDRVGQMAIETVLLDTQQAFDGVAAHYDRSNAENPLLCAMRDRVRRTVERFVTSGASILDLGCGPGCDIEYFARRGYRVTALDRSPAMIREARRRLDTARLGDRAVVHRLGIDEVDRLAPEMFDAAYSNFGPLNCVPDLAESARRIAGRLRSGGTLIASVIGRSCPWEFALYMSRGDWRRATIRYSRAPVPVPLDGRTVWTQYRAPRSFERMFAAAGFRRLHLQSLGLFAPPPYAHAFASRHTRLIALLERMDDVVGTWPLVRGHGDHFLIVLQRA